MMQLGAYFAGLAIENSMLGAAHATANPLTARYGVTHGQAVGVMLPSVIRFNAQQCCAEYYQLLREVDPEVPESDAAERLATLMKDLLRKSQLATSLSELSVTADQYEQLSADALKQWTGNFNPVSLTEEGVVDLYRSAT